MGSGITSPVSVIASLGIEISSLLSDQGSGCTIFVGLGTKICYAFGIKDQKFVYQNGISYEQTYLVMTELTQTRLTNSH